MKRSRLAVYMASRLAGETRPDYEARVIPREWAESTGYILGHYRGLLDDMVEMLGRRRLAALADALDGIDAAVEMARRGPGDGRTDDQT